jgi:hypothetical protein
VEKFVTTEWIKTVTIIILIIGMINFGREYLIIYQKYLEVRDKLETIAQPLK